MSDWRQDQIGFALRGVNLWHVSTRDDEALEQPPVDPLLGRLDQILGELAAIVADNGPTADAVRIDRIACLEKYEPSPRRHKPRNR